MPKAVLQTFGKNFQEQVTVKVDRKEAFTHYSLYQEEYLT